MDLSTVAGRAAAVAAVVSLLLWVLREKCVVDALQTNKWLTRGVSVACVALGAVVADWVPDRALTLATWLPVFLGAIPTTEFSYQWILKSVGSLGADRCSIPKGPAIGVGCVLLVVVLLCGSGVAQAAPAVSAGAMLVKGGETHLEVSASWKLVDLQVRGAPMSIYGDLFAVQGGAGGGLSTPVLQVLDVVGILDAVKLGPTVGALAPYLRVGCAVTRTGGRYDGGPYMMLALGQVTW